MKNPHRFPQCHALRDGTRRSTFEISNSRIRESNEAIKYDVVIRRAAQMTFLLSLLSVVGIVVSILLAPGWSKELFEAMTYLFAESGIIGIAALMTLAALTAFPAELPAVLFGALYGLVPGFVAIWITAMFGAVLGFGVGRKIGPTTFDRLIERRFVGRMVSIVRTDAGVPSLLLIRFVPLIPFFVVNIAAGFLGMNLRAFLLATGIGIAPMALLCSALGSGTSVAYTSLTGMFLN